MKTFQHHKSFNNVPVLHSAWVLLQKLMECCRSCEISQDTFFDYLVFKPGKFFHYDVYKTCNQSSEKADQPTHHPATDLQTAETLKHKTEEQGRKRADHSYKGLHGKQGMNVCFFTG